MSTGARKGEPQEANGGPSFCMDTLFSRRGVGLSQGRIFGTQSFVCVCVGGGSSLVLLPQRPSLLAVWRLQE